MFKGITLGFAAKAVSKAFFTWSKLGACILFTKAPTATMLAVLIFPTCLSAISVMGINVILLSL